MSSWGMTPRPLCMGKHNDQCEGPALVESLTSPSSRTSQPLRLSASGDEAGDRTAVGTTRCLSARASERGVRDVHEGAIPEFDAVRGAGRPLSHADLTREGKRIASADSTSLAAASWSPALRSFA